LVGGAASVLFTDDQLLPQWRQELGNFPRGFLSSSAKA
jgi:hypothetical protein